MQTSRVIATVVSRDPETRKRPGRGFSIPELKEAKISKILAKLMNVPIDGRRGTSYPENVAILKGLPKPEIKKKVRKPKKEKVKVPKKKKVKVAAVAEKGAEAPAKKAAKKTAKKVAKAVRATPITPAEEKVTKAATPTTPAKEKTVGLETLPKITDELVKKIKDIDVGSLQQLAKEDAKELSKILGIDKKLVQEWIDFAKKNK
jgi:hypothetical protein